MQQIVLCLNSDRVKISQVNVEGVLHISIAKSRAMAGIDGQKWNAIICSNSDLIYIALAVYAPRY